MIGCDGRNLERSVAVPWAGPTIVIPPPLPSYLKNSPARAPAFNGSSTGPHRCNAGQEAGTRRAPTSTALIAARGYLGPEGAGSRPTRSKNQTGQPVVRVPFDRTEATQAVGSIASPVRLVGISESVASIRGKAWAFNFLEIRAGIIRWPPNWWSLIHGTQVINNAGFGFVLWTESEPVPARLDSVFESATRPHLWTSS